ncbi:hypothetical protein C8Q76DRAFT_606638, partial [Earliella scabrosa]
DSDGGVETVEPDEYDQFFDDDVDMMNIDVPEEAALSAAENALCDMFREKLKTLSLQACEVCHKREFGLNVRDGQCSRCRADKGDPVKKFSTGNNAVPEVQRDPCLQHLTEMEEMLISRVLPMMQVRYTRGG